MTSRGELNAINMKAQMRKGVLDFLVLLIISQKEAYASDILGLLKKSDFIVVEGTLYPILSRLKGAEYLTYSWKESKNGPPRKYYKLTTVGEKALLELKGSWKSFESSINKLINKYEKGN